MTASDDGSGTLRPLITYGPLFVAVLVTAKAGPPTELNTPMAR